VRRVGGTATLKVERHLRLGFEELGRYLEFLRI
jgi:hypothetical protein